MRKLMIYENNDHVEEESAKALLSSWWVKMMKKCTERNSD